VNNLQASAASSLTKATDRATGQPAIAGNDIELLFDGPENYTVMLDMINSAERRIHLENYIIRDDRTGGRFAEALIAKAAEGVIVRVVYDWFGSLSTSNRYWQRLRAGGVEVRSFGKPQFRSLLSIVSRDHRKVLVVDGYRAVSGGLCIGDEWVGDLEEGMRPWRDTALRVVGPAARAIDQSFGWVWLATGGEAIEDGDEVAADVRPAGTTVVRVVATKPGEERTWRTIDLLLGIGAERIWVTEAYLAGPRRLYQAFEDAAADGVDVRLLVPGASDIPIVRNISRTGYRRLLRAGVRIWEWGGPMLHAKTISIDSRWVRVGSSNLNPSSLMANWELDLIVEDRALAKELDLRFSSDLTSSGEVIRKTRRLPLPGARAIGAPSALVVEQRPAETPHRLTMRERRKRAFLRAAVIGRGARSALLGMAATSLTVTALLLVLFPRAASYATAALFLLSALMLGLQAIGGRRRD
jgi:cardiolipin synthase